MRYAVLICFAVFGSIVAAVARADDVQPVSQYAGNWMLFDELDHSQCSFIFSDKSHGAGYLIEGLESCRDTFPELAEVVAWRPNSDFGVILVDNDGNVLADYAISETEGLQSVFPSHIFRSMSRTDPDPGITGSIQSARLSVPIATSEPAYP